LTAKAEAQAKAEAGGVLRSGQDDVACEAAALSGKSNGGGKGRGKGTQANSSLCHSSWRGGDRTTKCGVDCVAQSREARTTLRVGEKKAREVWPAPFPM
jgi:hypothetical protein